LAASKKKRDEVDNLEAGERAEGGSPFFEVPFSSCFNERRLRE